MDYFAVVFKNPDEDHIRIPHRFVRIWGHTLKNPLKITSSFGVESTVHFKEVDHTLWLDRGWYAFAREYEPQHKDVILLEYTGDSKFLISFFKPCGIEKYIPLHTSNFPTKFFKPFVKPQYFHRIKLNDVFNNQFGQQLRNLLTIYCDNSAVIKVRFKLEGNDVWLEKGWKDVAANCGIQLYNFIFFKYAGESRLELGIVDNRERPLICTCKRGIDNVEPVQVEKQTLWFTKITKSVKGGRQPLNIPCHIVHEWLNDKPNNIEIMLPSGEKESWTLLWYGIKNQDQTNAS